MDRGRAPSSQNIAEAETVATDDGPREGAAAFFDASTGASAGPPVDAPAVGLRIDRYVIVSRLGQGGMGTVYAGFDQELDRRIALKVLRPHHAERLGRARMQREAQALARLSHPNVVQVYDVGEFGGQLFIAMEYVKGETLAVWQRRHDPATPSGRSAILEMYVQAGRGLAAAHEAGFIHRDFKPSNVLVGEDGRARVLDFGIAAPRQADADPRDTGTTHPDGIDAAAHDDLTRTGTVLGTPAYMAPEQFLARATDPRTDVFAFSVALYEALLGASPFAGDDFTARKQAVLAGALRPVPAASNVPAWLRAVLVRGLAREPDVRPPGMDALLAALLADPVARRRRRWRVAGLALAALAAASLLVVLGRVGWERWQQQAAETRAAGRLAAVEARIAEALAAGASDEAERAFASFVTHPDNRGSAALGRAWLHRADRARDRADTPAAVEAFAGAYLVATAGEDRHAVLLGLARVFRDDQQWRGLRLALSALDARGAAGDDSVELAELRLDAALAGRDLDAASELLRGRLAGSPRAAALPVLTALQQATPTEHQHRGSAVIVDLDGDGAREVVLVTDVRERQIAPRLRAAPSLPSLGALDLGAGRIHALTPAPGEPALLITGERVTGDGAPRHETVVRRWQDGALVEVLRWPEDPVTAALAADLDGDGARELLLGSGPYTRRVTQLVRGVEGAWSTSAPASDIDRRRSDVVDLLADDLDGDGRVEVVAALGPWNAYELLLLRRDPATGALRWFTRRRLGDIAGAALVRRGPGGPEIVASKTDEYRNPTVFPPDRPDGEPAGVYLMRLVDDALVPTAFVPAPRAAAGGRVVLRRPLVGDLDGDGRDEVVVGCGVTDDLSAGERDSTIVLVGAVDGSMISVVLGDMRPIAVADLDDDGDAELIVGAGGGAPDRVWVLGSGTAAAPLLPGELLRPVDAAPDDPVLAAMLTHADELAQMGLVRQAAERLAAMVDQVAEPALRARLLLRAAELYSSLGADPEAAVLYTRAEDDAGAARSLLRLGRLDAAAARPTDGAPDVAVALADLRAAAIALEFTRPLAPTWRIGQPLALRRDGARGVLRVDAQLLGELLSAPVRWEGGSLVLTAELDLRQVEWRSGLAIGLVRDGAGLDDAASPLGVEVSTTGGGVERTHELACTSYGRRSVARLPFRRGDHDDRLGRVTLRATLLPSLGEWTCAVERAGGEVLHYGRNHDAFEAREAAPLRLAVAASRSPPARVDADLVRLTLAGADLAPTPPAEDDPLLRARAAFVEDDPLRTLAELDRATAPTSADLLLGVAAQARIGRVDAAVGALAPLLERADAAVDLQLRALLRGDPAVYGALVRGAVGPAQARRRLAEAWASAVLNEHDAHAYAVTWAGLADRDVATDTYQVLNVHGAAAAGLGHTDAARASYTGMLEALEDPARAGAKWYVGQRENEIRLVHLDLAAIALSVGDEPAARRELQPFLGEDTNLIFVDVLRAREDLRPLWDLAPR